MKFRFFIRAILDPHLVVEALRFAALYSIGSGLGLRTSHFTSPDLPPCGRACCASLSQMEVLELKKSRR